MAHLNLSHASDSVVEPTFGLQSPLLIPVSLIAAALFAFLIYGGGSQAEGIPSLGGFPLITAWRFFSKRHDFMLEGFSRTGKEFFQFKILQVSKFTFTASSDAHTNISIASSLSLGRKPAKSSSTTQVLTST